MLQPPHGEKQQSTNKNNSYVVKACLWSQKISITNLDHPTSILQYYQILLLFRRVLLIPDHDAATSYITL